MISERYFWSESDRISARKVVVEDPAMEVRKRLMKAVFFFMEESNEVSAGKPSSRSQSLAYHIVSRVHLTLVNCPRASILNAQLACHQGQ